MSTQSSSDSDDSTETRERKVRYKKYLKRQKGGSDNPSSEESTTESSESSEISTTDPEFANSDDLKSSEDDEAAEKYAQVIKMNKKHRLAASRQVTQVHKRRGDSKKLAVPENLFSTSSLHVTEEEEKEIREAKERLKKLQEEAAKNEAELNKVLEQNAKKAEIRKKHESYRERSIKKREGKKAKFKAMMKSFWATVKVILGILGLAGVIIGVIAIVGCEYQLDGIKDFPICKFGKDPNSDDGDRRLGLPSSSAELSDPTVSSTRQYVQDSQSRLHLRRHPRTAGV